MDEEAEKIVNTASDIFLSKGFHKTPVDDIASSLKMSKKTIYKHFLSKDDIIRAVVKSFLQSNGVNITRIMNNDDNAVKKMINIANYFGSVIFRINEQWFYDLQNHSPELWEEIEEFRFKMMDMNFRKVINQGKKEKYFVDSPTEIILSIFIYSIRSIVNPKFLLENKIAPADALGTTIEIIMYGILTDKGKKYLKKLDREQS